MIELNRYARVKPEGLVVAKAVDSVGLNVYFKRFDVENGKEIEPEISYLRFAELEDKLAELKRQQLVVEELLVLRPK